MKETKENVTQLTADMKYITRKKYTGTYRFKDILKAVSDQRDSEQQNAALTLHDLSKAFDCVYIIDCSLYNKISINILLVVLLFNVFFTNSIYKVI